MAFLILTSLILTATALVRAHDGHDHDLQMPMGYVKYPYQAMYPGDNTGPFRSGIASSKGRLT